MADTVSVDELEVGMIVGVDVIDSNGSLLVQAGTKLNNQMISVLKRRDIKNVQVITAHDEEKRQATEALETAVVRARRDARMGKRATERLDKILNFMDELFKGYENDDVMVPLKTVAIQYWQRRAQAASDQEEEEESS